MNKIRQHRGSLSDSMETVRKVEDRAELVRVVQDSLRPFGVDVAADQISVTPYAKDERIGWDTHLIQVEGYGVWGMADGPIA